MSEARAQILTSIRLALGRGAVDAETRQALEARLAGHRREHRQLLRPLGGVFAALHRGDERLHV